MTKPLLPRKSDLVRIPGSSGHGFR